MLQAKATTSPVALAGIIERALKAKDLFSFGELLDIPGVQALQGTPQQSALDLLSLFAYSKHGYGEYAEGVKTGRFPADLHPQAVNKLRQLTLTSVAASAKSLQYGQLYSVLGLNDGDAAALEEVIVQTISAGLLEGRIDQRASRLEVTSVHGRDIPATMESVDELLSKVRRWKAVVEEASADISAELSELQRLADEEASRKRALEDAAAKAAKGSSSSSSSAATDSKLEGTRSKAGGSSSGGLVASASASTSMAVSSTSSSGGGGGAGASSASGARGAPR